jgi:hypothetical protein
MAISVSCPSCARQYSVKDEAAGKKFRCKDCGAVVQVPDGGGGGGDEAFSDDYGDPYNPYADDEMAGGGAAPPPMATRRPKRRSGASRAAAAERTKLPAIFLLIVVSLSFLYHVVNLGFYLAGAQPMMLPQAQNPAEELGQKIGMAVGGVLGFVFVIADLVVLWSAICLLRARSYGMALTGSILAVIPCLSPCCFLGIPFGIWSLVVLNDETVKAGFE